MAKAAKLPGELLVVEDLLARKVWVKNTTGRICTPESFLSQVRRAIMRSTLGPDFPPKGWKKDQLAMIRQILVAYDNDWVSDAGPDMEHGVWQYFQGGIYRSLAVATWTGATGDGIPFVSYMSMVSGRQYGRPCSEWAEMVPWPDGTLRSRFIFRGTSV